LFDEDDPTYAGSTPPYIEACNEAVGLLEPADAAVVRWGAMLTYLFTQRVIAVRRFDAGGYGVHEVDRTSTSIVDDREARHVLCLHIHDYFLSQHVVRPQESWTALTRNTIWVVAYHPLAYDIIRGAEQTLSSLPGYLGVVPVDMGCPVLRRLLWRGLATRHVVGPGPVIRFVPEIGMDDDDQWTRPEIEDVRSLTNGGWIGGDPEQVYSVGRVPSSPLTNFGRDSVRLLEAVMRPTRRELVARALRSVLHTDIVPRGFQFNVGEHLSMDDGVEVAEEKLTRYLLNADHEQGGSKARWFSDVLGIGPNDWMFLLEQLRSRLPISMPETVRVTEFGVGYSVNMSILGLNGRTATARTVWFASSSGPPRFITAIPVDSDGAIAG
jgi:hypothetical protein